MCSLHGVGVEAQSVFSNHIRTRLPRPAGWYSTSSPTPSTTISGDVLRPPVMRTSPTMADIRRPGLTSLFPFVVLLCHLLCLLHAAHALDFPTAGMSTGWSSTATMEHAVNFVDEFGKEFQVRSPLLRRSREGSGPSYACGFFYSAVYSSTAFNSFYFAIIIIQLNSSGDVSLSSEPQVVWMANRNRPVAENATLQLGSDGDLVLTDADGTKVWSTNTSGKSVTGMNLTEYGNLVLFGDGGKDIVWDSFHHPTDSLVPGQKLRIGQSLLAATGYGNATEGNYYLSATPTGLMAFSRTEPPTRYACILTTDNTRKIENFEFMNGSISTTSLGQYMPPSQFLRLEYDGSLAVYEWNSTPGRYEVYTILFGRHSYCSASFDPTAALSTRWTSTPKNMEDIVKFTDGSQVRSPLLRRREDAGPTYSCGFYCKWPCDSFLFAAIIIYVESSGNILLSAEPQVVWVANRGRPVGGKATLHLGSGGDLVLTDSDGAKVWSTDTSGEPVGGLNLTERGNLVLFGGDKNDTIVWESSAHPTDSLVPTQKLYVGQRLTANDSATNATEGLYYLYADSTGLIPFIQSNPPTRYAPPIAVSINGTTEYFEFMNGLTTTSSSSAQYMPPTQFLRLESDGHLRVYRWSPRNATWGATEDLIAFIKVQIPGSQEPRTPNVLILGLTLGAFFLLILVVDSFILVGRRKMKKERDASAQLEEEEDLQPLSGMPKRFSFDELRAATDGFCRKLGQGGFGSVYEGRIDAEAIAVKCLDGAGQGRKEFLAEVQTIGRLHHVNLVKLIGYCAEKSRRLLVYELMPNGSLDGWIFSGEYQKASLDWQMRRKIILGVAKGLSYLHEDCSQRIAHLDIKPHNILLDDKFEAKISDFGLAKLIDRDLTHVETRMRGTVGYLAPEWLSSKITEKADVYSFGVVVLEMICGRRNLDRSESEEGMMLVSLLKKKAENNELVDLVDETIKNTDFHGEVMKMMKIVMWCLQHQKDRPSMSTVVKILEGDMDTESNLEDIMFRAASTVECNDGIDASSCARMLASVLSEPR